MLSLIPFLKNRYLPLLFAIPLFFCTYRYQGIVVDAVLYVTQYVFSIDPARFSGDPSFDFGNQGSLGFFSPIFGLFIEPFGVATGAFVYTWLTQFLWVVAYTFFVKNLLRLSWQRLWVLPVLILLACIFANGSPFSHIAFFHYISSYACSRSLSIVLGLGGVALLFRQKKILSILFILVGTAIHPLSAGWCLPFWLFYFFPKTRIPVAIASFVFPLTGLLHIGPLDTYPADWLSRPLSRPGYALLTLYAFLEIFFGQLIKRTANSSIKNISVAMCLLTAISFFWDLCAGYGEHIFLYQVQPWRALWLPSLIAAPLGICFVKDNFRQYAKKRPVTTKNLGGLLLFTSFFVSVHPFSILLIIAILLLRKEKVLTLKLTTLVFGIVLLGGYLIQQYILCYLRGSLLFVNLPIIEFYNARDSFFTYQLFLTLYFVGFFLKKRLFLPAGLMFFSIFLARFALLPSLPFLVYFLPQKNKLKYWGGICLAILIIALDGVFDAETRAWVLVQNFPPSFFSSGFAAFLSVAAIYLSKKFSYKGIITWVLACGVTAGIIYGIHAQKQIQKDLPLDRYCHNTIFSQVGDRGHVLFYVSGFYQGNPRLQFMTGSYFNDFVQSGTVFYKGHYREALERSHLLIWKKRAPESDILFTFGAVPRKLANTDTLIDRTAFLCQEKEIHHLVTDKSSLPFPKEDSTIVGETQQVYLYACPVDSLQ